MTQKDKDELIKAYRILLGRILGHMWIDEESDAAIADFKDSGNSALPILEIILENRYTDYEDGA